MNDPSTIQAVLFDLGGVLATSPAVDFAAYETRAGLPEGFIRRAITTNPESNAWDQFERGQLTQEEFATALEAETKLLGVELDGREVLRCLNVELRPEMVAAVAACAARLKTALLTNNFVPGDVATTATAAIAEISTLVDVVVESAIVGVRKPDPKFYEIACQRLGVAPANCVFLDDLGSNLKSAKAMGMTTIKVSDPQDALEELEAVVGFPVR